MQLPQLPVFEDIFPNLEQLATILYEVFEVSTPEAKDYFENRGEPIDRYLFNDLVRYGVKKRLVTRGHSVVHEEEEHGAVDNGNSFRPLANNGLAGAYNGYRYRILKADDGTLPPPSPSKRKQAFFSQQLAFPDMGIGDQQVFRPNVVFLWETDSKSNFSRLQLSCPKSGDGNKAEHYFTEPIPHPVELLKAEFVAEQVPPEVDEIALPYKQPSKSPEKIDDLQRKD